MVDLEDALVSTKAYGSYLRLLLAEPAGGATGAAADRLFLPAAQGLVERARRLADFVIVDSPPLTEVIDALPLAQKVDEVLVVVRLKKTPLTRLTQLGELLAQHGIQPVGFAVVGAPQTSKTGYYYVPRKTPSSSTRRARQAEREAV
jgi:Mrp family chromosome partitioning ATPase